MRTQGGISESEAVRNNCYSLLHQLLGDEKNVSKLRFVKREDAELKELMKKVSASAGAAQERIDGFAAADHALMLNDLRLPPGEMKTRDAISSTKEKTLLLESGGKFELELLLSQSEALGYASHLARVAGENDKAQERAQYLAGLSVEMKNLQDEVESRLAVKMPVKP